jgi:hypothetical protein
MQIVPKETSLVIAGAWNAAILTPNWVLKYGLQKKGEEPVKIFFSAALGTVFEFPRYELNEFSFVVGPQALILSPPETVPEKLERVEDAAARMLDILKYTPVNGVGHNFEFQDENPSSDDLAVFTAARQDFAEGLPCGWVPAASTLTSSFMNASGNVILNIIRIFDAGTVKVKFNFHHPVPSVEKALEILRGETGYERMAKNLQMANNIISSIYEDTNDHKH